MKYLAFVCMIAVFVSCNDSVQKKETVQDEQASSELIQKDASEEDKPIENTTGIAMLNYEELEDSFLKNTDDTLYVINFWATWCKPCIKELPYFEQITENYNQDKVKVVLVSLDFPEKIVSTVGPFVKKNNLQSEVVLLDDADANKWIPLVSEEWSGAIPATVIYNKNERKFYERSFTFEELDTEIKSFL